MVTLIVYCMKISPNEYRGGVVQVSDVLYGLDGRDVLQCNGSDAQLQSCRFIMASSAKSEEEEEPSASSEAAASDAWRSRRQDEIRSKTGSIKIIRFQDL